MEDHERRITRLEDSMEEMSKALTQLVSEVRMAKWVLGMFFAIAQPVVVSIIVLKLGVN